MRNGLIRSEFYRLLDGIAEALEYVDDDRVFGPFGAAELDVDAEVAGLPRSGPESAPKIPEEVMEYAGGVRPWRGGVTDSTRLGVARLTEPEKDQSEQLG